MEEKLRKLKQLREARESCLQTLKVIDKRIMELEQADLEDIIKEEENNDTDKTNKS